MADLQARLPKLHLVVVKLDPLFHELLSIKSNIPALAVFAPPDAVCLFTDPNTCVDVDSRIFNTTLGFLFWDIVHPTTEAHHRLGDYIYQQLVDSY